MSFPSKFRGRCSLCGEEFPAGELIDYDRATKKASHADCKGQERPPDASQAPQEGREPGEGVETPAPSPTARPRGRTGARMSPEEAHARVVEHGRADVVLCEMCGGSAAGRPVVHVSCQGEGIGDEVPF